MGIFLIITSMMHYYLHAALCLTKSFFLQNKLNSKCIIKRHCYCLGDKYQQLRVKMIIYILV